jgi:hypothetical protein
MVVGALLGIWTVAVVLLWWWAVHRMRRRKP